MGTERSHCVRTDWVHAGLLENKDGPVAEPHLTHGFAPQCRASLGKSFGYAEVQFLPLSRETCLSTPYGYSSGLSSTW